MKSGWCNDRAEAWSHDRCRMPLCSCGCHHASAVQPRIGSLFSGYGGLDQAVETVTGGRTVWVSDIDSGACKILAHRYPDVPNLGDVTTVDWADVEPVEVLCAGFPCQDVSAAGKRAGLRHGTRTGLWHEVVRAIAALRPRLVVLENVRGLLTSRGDEPTDAHLAAEATRDACDHLLDWVDTQRARAITEGRTEDARRLAARRGRVVGCRRRAVARARWHERRLVRAIGTVLGSLADLGFDAELIGLRAADVDAPHGRFRVFIVAYPQGQPWRVLDRDDGSAAVASDFGHERLRSARDGRARPANGGLLPTPRAGDGTKGGPNQRGSSGDLMPSAVQMLPTPTARDGKGHNQRRDDTCLTGALVPTPLSSDAGPRGGTTGFGLRDWSRSLLPTPTAQDSSASGGSSASDVTLTDAVVRTEMGTTENPRLLPTPKTTDVSHVHISERARTLYSSGDLMADVIDRDQWGKYADAIARWEHATRPAPPPTELSAKGAPRLSARFSEWLMGPPDGWITDVPGITRNEALKACGNGVVPQQAEAALRVLLARTTPTPPVLAGHANHEEES